MSDPLSVLPGWLTGFLEIFRQGTPAVYATTVYGICHWADSKASDEAKALITNLLQPKQYDKHAVGGTIIWLFDKVYTQHLLSWRAFARSALFTICMTVIFLYESYPGREHSLLYNIVQNPGSNLARAAIYSFAASIITNIVSDYVSLFAVRRLLVLGSDRSLSALWIGPLVGIMIVAVLNLVISNAVLALVFFLQTHGLHGTLNNYFNLLYALAMGTFAIPEWRALLVAALVVHLWLPLFGLCVALLRAANYARQAVGWTQWFLKEGKQQPLEAIGYVAAPIVFVGTLIVQGIERGASRWL